MKQRSADVVSVQTILAATTEHVGAFGGAVEEVADWYAESGLLQAYLTKDRSKSELEAWSDTLVVEAMILDTK
jgi:hypothetical protein